MKKLVFLILSILFVAAACNKSGNLSINTPLSKQHLTMPDQGTQNIPQNPVQISAPTPLLSVQAQINGPINFGAAPTSIGYGRLGDTESFQVNIKNTSNVAYPDVYVTLLPNDQLEISEDLKSAMPYHLNLKPGDSEGVGFQGVLAAHSGTVVETIRVGAENFSPIDVTATFKIVSPDSPAVLVSPDPNTPTGKISRSATDYVAVLNFKLTAQNADVNINKIAIGSGGRSGNVGSNLNDEGTYELFYNGLLLGTTTTSNEYFDGFNLLIQKDHSALFTLKAKFKPTATISNAYIWGMDGFGVGTIQNYPAFGTAQSPFLEIGP